MRTSIAASAMTIGSFAFQIGLQAGWFNNLVWIAPWAWGLSAALWVWWLLSHPKVESEWLKQFHIRAGRGIYVIRALLCLLSFFVVGVGIMWLMRSKTDTVAASQTATPTQQNTQVGNGNNGGNISQGGDHNTAVIGNNAKVGNTYNFTTTDKTVGWLTPAHNATPPTNCHIGEPSSSDLIIFLGDSASWVSKNWTFPFNVMVIGGHPVLSLSKDAQGRIALTGEVLNDKDDAVAVIKNNKFTASGKNAFLVDSTKSDLDVTVEHLNENVLSVSYLNAHAIKVRGHFHYKGTDVLVTEDEIVVNRNVHMSGACTAHARGAAFSF